MPDATRRARMLRGVLLLALVVLGAAAAFAFKVSEKMPDLEVYLRAGQRAAAAEPLYRAEDGHYQFKYLPAFALLVAPLGAMPPATARIIWFAASVASLGLLVFVSARIVRLTPEDGEVRLKPYTTTDAPIVVVITVLVLAKFYARELLLGQANAFFALTAVCAVLALRHGRETLAGLLTALTIVVKPYGVVLVPWLLARRRPQSISALLAGLVLAVAAPAAVYGFRGNVDLHRGWWSTVVDTTPGNLLNPDNVSWLAMYTRLLGESSPWPPMLAGLTLAAAGLMFAWMWRRRSGIAFPEGLEGALLLLLVPFVSPQGWDYVLVIATTAVMYVVAFGNRLHAAVRWPAFAALAVTAVTVYDLVGRDAYHAFMNASGVTLAFLPVMFALCAIRRRRLG